MDYKAKCKEIRQLTYDMVIKAGKGHLGGSFSCVEILVALYYGGILKENDKFILSKGHANNAYYVILADLGYFPKEQLNLYCQDGGFLGGHCDINVPGVHATTGALGHGLSIAAGIALANKLNNNNDKVFVVVGDGEMQEGSMWEALIFINQHKLNNLYLIIDHNKLGSEDYLENTGSLDSLAQKINAFGFSSITMHGHDAKSIAELFNDIVLTSSANKPIAIIANTTKGKGMPWCENLIHSHHTLPNKEDREKLRNAIY